MNDDRVRGAFHDLASEAPDSADLLDRTERRIAQRRTRNRLVAATGVGVAAIVVAVGAVAVLNDDPSTGPHVETPPADSTPTTIAAAEPQPDGVLVAKPDGSVVRLDLDGRQIEELVPPAGPNVNLLPIVDMQMTSDGESVAILLDGGDGNCGAVQVLGSETDFGTGAALINIGGDIGVVTNTNPNNCGATVFDAIDRLTASGREPFWSTRVPSDGVANSVSFDRNATRFTVSHCRNAPCNVEVFGTEPTQSAPLAQLDTHDTSTWSIAWLGDRVAVAEESLYAVVPPITTVATYDVETGDRVDELFSWRGSQDIEVRSMEADPSGSKLLLVKEEPEGGAVLVWDGSGDPKEIAAGAVAATWAYPQASGDPTTTTSTTIAPPETADGTVPDVVGLSLQDATNALEAVDQGTETFGIDGAPTKTSNVVWQEPPSGARLTGTVKLWTCNTPDCSTTSFPQGWYDGDGFINTPWREFNLQGAPWAALAAADTLGASPTEATDRIVHDLAVAFFDGPERETTSTRLLSPSDGTADLMISQRGYADDSVYGADFRITLVQGPNGWSIGPGAQTRELCARGSDAAVCV